MAVPFEQHAIPGGTTRPQKKTLSLAVSQQAQDTFQDLLVKQLEKELEGLAGPLPQVDVGYYGEIVSNDVPSERVAPRIRGQDYNQDLESWLCAFCPIPNNVCYLYPEDISDPSFDSKKMSVSQYYEWKMQQSEQWHRKVGIKKPPFPPQWRPRGLPENWYGQRVPTVNDLITQAYRQGAHFMLKRDAANDGSHLSPSSSSSNTSKVKVPHCKPSPAWYLAFLRKERKYFRLKLWLKKNAHIYYSDVEVIEGKIKRHEPPGPGRNTIQPEQIKLDNWLRDRDCLNPFNIGNRRMPSAYALSYCNESNYERYWKLSLVDKYCRDNFNYHERYSPSGRTAFDLMVSSDSDVERIAKLTYEQRKRFYIKAVSRYKAGIIPAPRLSYVFRCLFPEGFKSKVQHSTSNAVVAVGNPESHYEHTREKEKTYLELLWAEQNRRMPANIIEPKAYVPPVETKEDITLSQMVRLRIQLQEDVKEIVRAELSRLQMEWTLSKTEFISGLAGEVKEALQDKIDGYVRCRHGILIPESSSYIV